MSSILCVKRPQSLGALARLYEFGGVLRSISRGRYSPVQEAEDLLFVEALKQDFQELQRDRACQRDAAKQRMLSDLPRIKNHRVILVLGDGADMPNNDPGPDREHARNRGGSPAAMPGALRVGDASERG